jgi:hypothetical protein
MLKKRKGPKIIIGAVVVMVISVVTFLFLKNESIKGPSPTD